MLSRSSDLPQESLQIKKDNKFYSRLLSKESSAANPSLRVYYGVASGAVPFVWESQPGTPKNSIPTATLPPLTPPPSYHFSPKNKSCTKKSPKSILINTILPRLILRKTHAPPSTPSLSLSSPSESSSSSSSFSPMGSSGSHRRRRFSSSRSSFSSRGEDEDSDDGSPTSTMCFGVRHGAASGVRGCHSIVIMKNALLSIVGNGSGQGTAA